ncbi:LacI family DNA-binding transcriptional regulator [Cellulomonas endophytica]|uniref:LacI family DNA-binding transcriptional regulator n=1 Tax=Cellulomonas endophytica TaxID=2494735 RepID=UPI001F0C43AC|nr:LacI family DNA-binding transcriptional regulator [Cellulomonas endophytica]
MPTAVPPRTPTAVPAAPGAPAPAAPGAAAPAAAAAGAARAHRPPVLAEVAARAEVSVATVSRVLNDRGGSAAARRRVGTALDVLGYERPAHLAERATPPVPDGVGVPEPVARGLVGLVLPDLGNPVFPRFAGVVERCLAAAGLTPLLCTLTPGGVHEDAYVRVLRAHGAAGVVFASGLHANTEADPARYHALHADGMPFVLVNGAVPGLDVPAVAHDDALGTRQAVRHLRQLGHVRVGLVLGPVRYTPSRRRAAAFAALVAERELGPEAAGLVAHDEYGAEGGERAAARLLAAGATALVCASDLQALGAVRAVRAAGLAVPGDVSVVGSDDSPLLRFTDPPLTTVRQDVEGVGATAVQALLDEMRGGRAAPGGGARTEILLPPELVLRGTTAPPSARSLQRLVAAR